MIDLLEDFGTYPPILWYYGEHDSVVPPFQATLFKSTLLGLVGATNSNSAHTGITTPILEQYGRSEQKHEWRDLDRAQYEEWGAFFDLHLRGLKDNDQDGLFADPSGLDLDDSNPDVDGDGQPDGNEYIFANNDLSAVDDPNATFRITDISQELIQTTPSTLDHWEITIKFSTSAQIPAAAYYLQSAKWLLNDLGVNQPHQYYPDWKDVNPRVLPTVVVPGKEYAFVVKRYLDSPSAEKFYRVAIDEHALAVGPLTTPFRRVTTAPAGILRGTIQRDENLSIRNLVCSPFMRPDTWRGKVELASSKYSTATALAVSPGAPMSNSQIEAVDLTVKASAFNPALPLQTSANPPIYFCESGSHLHYAIVQSDRAIESTRPTPNPDEKGMAGHWWFPPVSG